MNVRAWRYQRFHPSYLLAWLSAGLLVGLLVGRHLDISSNALSLCVGLVLLLGGFRSRRWWAVVLVTLAGLSLGALRGSFVEQQYQAYQPLFSKSVTVKGRLSGDAQRRDVGGQKITLAHITIGGIRYPGELFVTVFSGSNVKRGDTVQVTGEVREGFASYGATMSSGKIIQVERHADIIRDIRERFSDSVRRVVLEPMASLGLGFVVGQRSTLPIALDEQLKIVGLTHIVVASGYNLTILVRFMMRLLARYSRYLAFVGSLMIIVSFVLFSGFSPSMNRAVVVTILGLLAWYVGRRFHPILLIAYVAAATAFLNPMYVWSDLGWYLSFFAFAGVLVVAPLVLKVLYTQRHASPFEQLVFETMSAELMALPLIAFAFSNVPVFGLIANVLVGPFIPAAMVLTAVTGAVGMFSVHVASFIALPTMVLIGYMIAIVEWLAKLPIAQFALDFNIGTICAWYVAVVIAGVYIHHRTHYDFRKRDAQLEV